jgi:hypothetical protein
MRLTEAGLGKVNGLLHDESLGAVGALSVITKTLYSAVVALEFEMMMEHSSEWLELCTQLRSPL